MIIDFSEIWHDSKTFEYRLRASTTSESGTISISEEAIDDASAAIGITGTPEEKIAYLTDKIETAANKQLETRPLCEIHIRSSDLENI